MAYEHNETNGRKQSRQRQRARQRARLYNRLALAAVLAVILLVIGILIFRTLHTPQDPHTSTPPVTTTPPIVTTPAGTLPDQPETVITILAGGDINVTDQVVASGQGPNGFDYTNAFLDIAPLFANADAAIVNFEGNLAGTPYGSGTTSAPQAMMQALQSAGVDFIQTANSCAVNNGIGGLRSTIDGIRQAGMEPLGTFATEAEFDASQGFTIRNIGGIRVAFVAFTKGMNGLGLPSGNEHCVNLLYTDYATTYQKIDTAGITAILQAVQAQKPDVTIALLHWGSEYNRVISARQETISKLMLENGVDAIIGTHSHFVQDVVYDRENGTIIAYGLGDLYGNATKNDTQYSILLELEITRDNMTGETRITGCDYIPVYTLTPDRDGESMRVVRIVETMTQYENNHISKIGDTAYQSLKAALAKIRSRTGLYQ